MSDKYTDIDDIICEFSCQHISEDDYFSDIVAEVSDLRAERDELRAEVEYNCTQYVAMKRKQGQCIRELKAEVERLNKAYIELGKSKVAEINCANEQYEVLEQQLAEAEAVQKVLAEECDDWRGAVGVANFELYSTPEQAIEWAKKKVREASENG